MNRNANSVKVGQSAGQIIGKINGRPVVGLDIAKSVFQLHSVDMDTGEIVNQQLKRAKVLEHFANCHDRHPSVRLIHARAVRPFALCLCYLATRPTPPTHGPSGWPFSSPAPNLSVSRPRSNKPRLLHRQRELLMKIKAMQTNALRGLFDEFGATFARDKKALFGKIEAALEALDGKGAIPQYVADSLREQAQRIKALAQDILALEVCSSHNLI